MKRSILLLASIALLAFLALAPLSQAQTSRPSGSVVVWGSNSYGLTDVPVAAKSGVVAIAAEERSTMALKNDGSVLAWGNNPEVPADLPPALAIAAGIEFVILNELP